ncbi:phage antirepressor N-terminal domain-containing protein [Eggerthellaceae bacterium 24-137]
MSEIVHIQFAGCDVECIGGSEPMKYSVGLRRMCENMGLDYSAQLRRLNRQPWATVAIMTTVAEDGKFREMATIDRQTFVMWLATIDTGRVKSEQAREVIIRYQKECAQVLDSYFSKGIAATPQRIEEMIADPDFAIGLLNELKREREAKERLQGRVDRLAPKALFADAVGDSNGLILVRDMAKMLSQAGLKIGGTRLYERLRADGFIEKLRNVPTQRAIDMGVMRLVEHTVRKPDGEVKISATPKITGKGQEYFMRRYTGRAVGQTALDI